MSSQTGSHDSVEKQRKDRKDRGSGKGKEAVWVHKLR